MDIQEEKKQLHIVDDYLIAIAPKLNIQKSLTPTNLLAERDIFIQKNGQYNPQFTYNFPIEEELKTIIKQLHSIQEQYFKTKIYVLPIANILNEKIKEHIYKAQLLIAYIQQDFIDIDRYNTLLFWTFSQDILDQSEYILRTYQDPDPTIRWRKLDNKEVKIYIENYLTQENISDIKLRVVDFSMNKFLIIFGEKNCSLVFSKNLQTRERNLQANLIHEIQVHYRRYQNSRLNEWKVLAYGVSQHIIDEEWLAIYDMCEYKKQYYPNYRKKSIYEKYVLLYYSQWKSFVDISEHMNSLGIVYTLKRRFIMVATIKRGIKDTSKRTLGNSLIKDKIYAEGLDKITKWIDQWNNKQLLYQWKIKIEDLPYMLS